MDYSISRYCKISLDMKILFVYVKKDPFTNAIAISHLLDVMSP